MAAPPFVPADPVDQARSYRSPDHIPTSWMPARPAAVGGRQPQGSRLGSQGPDQGYALVLARRLRDRLVVRDGERIDDALQGAVLVGLRRASLFGRAPVMHDLTVGARVWGFLDANPPSDLVDLRRAMFEGIANTLHHYSEGRAVADQVPEATLGMTPQEIERAYPGDWKQLLGM